MIVKYKIAEEGARPPFRAHEDDAGIDLCVMTGADLLPGETVKLSTGLAFELPAGTYGDIRARSSTTLRGLSIAGVVDASYRGTVYLLVTNVGCDGITIRASDRLAQMIVSSVVPCSLEWCADLSSTERGAGGFGSTGR